MRIWIIAIGEPVPSAANGGQRLHRAGILASLLATKGNDVVWWTSSFDHFSKRYISEGDPFRVGENLEVVPLNGCAYHRNVSLDRIKNHRQIAAHFERLSAKAEPPDVILVAYPTIELSASAVEFGKLRGIPVVVDVRDLWPDIFLELAPKVVRPVAKAFLSPMFRQSARVFRDAAAVSGVTQSYVKWGCDRGGRNVSAVDRPFPFGYPVYDLSSSERREAERYWDSQGILAGDFNVTFIGTIGRQFDFNPVLEAARLLNGKLPQVRFLICGKGDRTKYWREKFGSLPNVVFPGWVNAAQIQVLLERSKLGLAPYVDSDNFKLNIPNKPAEYFSAGLPIALSLKDGVLAEMLAAQKAGFCYANAEQLAGNISELVSDQQRWEDFSKNARDLFNARFKAETVYSEMQEYLCDLAASYKKGKSS